MSIKIDEREEKVEEMNQEVTTFEEEDFPVGEQENDMVQIEEVKKGPVAWFKGLKTWQQLAIGGVVVGVTVYGGVKLRKVLKKNSKQVVEAIEEAQPVKVVVPMDSTNATDMAVQGLVNELAKAE